MDFRLAVRLLYRTPTVTAIALISIALSIGPSAVVFAAVKSVLLDPLPYAHPESLVQLGSEFPQIQQQPQSDWVVWNDTRELARSTRTLESIATYGNAVFDLAGGSGATPEALYGLHMTANLFPALGVAPMLGRNFTPEEDQPGRPDEMILSHGLWVRRFQADPAVVGRTVAVNGHACLIVGVMPPDFNFPLRRAAAHTPSPYVEFWAVPFHIPANPNAGLGAVARLRPGIRLEQARQDLAGISERLAHNFPATNRSRVLTLNNLRDRAVGAAGKRLWLLLAAALLFVLIGCANVANLLLARALARQREIAIRSAIGAARWHIVRQLLSESCVLAVLGGLGGYALSAAAWKVLPSIAPVSIPRLAAARADGAIFAFVLATALINGILFGIAPALRLIKGNQAIALAGTGTRGAAVGRHDRLRSSLVAAEVAISALLVLVGGQLLASFVRLMAIDPGFQANRVLASVILPAPARYPDPDQRALFYQRILDSVRALPGVESAGTVDALPFSGENHGGFVSAGEDTRVIAEIDVAGGDYLQTLGVHLLAGRWFRPEDMNLTGDAAIIDEFTAARLWPGSAAVDQRICVDCTPERPNNWKRVIGVVSSAIHAALNEPAKGNVYLAAGAMRSSVFLVVRTTSSSAALQHELERAIRRAVAAIDPDQPVFLSASLQTLIQDSVADRRFVLTLLAVTAWLALLMSAAGIYGVVSYTTALRTQEISIRMALGATPRHVHAMIFRQGFAAIAIGLAVGIGAALVALHTIRRFWVGLETASLASVWMAVALVTATAALACWIPARRATVIEIRAGLEA